MQNAILPTALLAFLLFFSSIQLYQPKSSAPHHPTKLPIPALDQPIHLLSLNTWGLPIRLPGHHQKKRFRAIPQTLIAESPDIICLQECFSNKLRKALLHQLDGKYHIQSNYQCNRRLIGSMKMDCFGGLMTFSKFPILAEQFFAFPRNGKMSITEKTGRKGFLISQIQMGEKRINLINTHLYAGNSEHAELQRFEQMKYLESVLDTFLQNHPYDCLLVGDLNITHPLTLPENKALSPSFVYDYLTTELRFNDPVKKWEACHFTIDPNRNPYCKSKDGPQKLDYCMLRAAKHSMIDQIDSQTTFTGKAVVSDHLGLWSTILLKEPALELPENIPVVSR